MEDISNKEVVDKLIEYYKTQDVNVIYRMMANAALDYHRWANIESLSIEDYGNLFFRCNLNSQQLQKFVKNGPDGDIVLHMRE